MNINIKRHPLSSWGFARGADAIEVVLWLYTHLGENITVKWLLDLANILLSQTQDWEAEMRRGGSVRYHVVNTTQGYKQPFFKYKLTEDSECINAFKTGLEMIGRDHGRIDNMPNADEPARDNLPTRGTETCAVVEGIHSMVLAGEISGESFVYDIAEGYAYNNLPNCYTYDISGYCYYQMQNQVMATRGTHGFLNDHGDSCALGISGFECCFSNLHMGYPKFVQYMWMKENEDTLVLTMYGENEINTKINNKSVVFEQITSYPYADKILLKYSGDKAKFKLKLRVPEWSEYIKVNEEKCEIHSGYVTIEREFIPGEEINIEFKSEIKVVPWHHNSKYVKKGAALYCMPIKENWVESFDNRLRGIKYKAKCGMKNYETFPKEKWNYTLPEHPNFELYENPNYCSDKHIDPENSPCYIKTNLSEVVNWGLKGNVCDTIENALLGSSIEKSLIPYAYTRLKISVFPKTEAELINSILSFEGEIFDIEVENSDEVVSVIFPTVDRSETVIIVKEAEEEYKIANKIYSNNYKFGNDKYGKRIDLDKCAIMTEKAKNIEIKVARLIKGNVVAVGKVK